MSIESNIFGPGHIHITACVPTVRSYVILEVNINLEVFNLGLLLYSIIIIHSCWLPTTESRILLIFLQTHWRTVCTRYIKWI